MELIKEVGEEILTEEELKELLEQKKHPIAYDGFEPSGNVHIAQGILRAITVNKMTKAGVKFKMLAANWHAWANNKYGGDLEKIQIAGKYLIEVWKACDMDFDNVEFVWDDDLKGKPSYWKGVMKIAQSTTIQRMLRCSEIMGRTEAETRYASQILYPAMQCNDIFQLECDITQLGMDQRKVNVLAREVGPKLGWWKPVVVSHHMLMGLLEPPKTQDTTERAMALKMSKSRPESAIFMTDSKEEVERKIKNAYCPAKQVQENPILEYCKYILFEKCKEITIERPEKFGGNVAFSSYQGLEKDFASGALHPQDLKKAVALYVNELLEPVRKHFEKNQKARALLKAVQSFHVTR